MPSHPLSVVPFSIPPATTPRGLRRHGGKGAIALLSTIGLLGCAHAPSDLAARADYQRDNDPAEPVNRAVFGANQFIDRNALKPVAAGYSTYVPGGVRRSVHNFVGNLGEPAVAVNDLLQGNVSRAWNTTQRFVINSTAGGAGLFDVASDLNRPGHQADFGQTLGVWGVGPGPAVQLPLLGPSNVRDSVGTVAGILANPLGFIPGGAITAITATGTGLGVIDGRALLIPTTDGLEQSSLDYYATLRSISTQRRAALVEEGRAGTVLAKPPPVTEQGVPVSR